MKQDAISMKILTIAVIAGACFVASAFVLELVSERQARFSEAKAEIADKWSKSQVVAGPMIAWHNAAGDIYGYVLPEKLRYETVLVPEVRSRGIFKSVVYSSTVRVSGEFLSEDIRRATAPGYGEATFAVAITDTRGIEKQIDLSWNGATYAFEPGPGIPFEESSGLHAPIPVDAPGATIPFSFELPLKGSEGISFAPLGNETVIAVGSAWPSPKFVGAFLPSDRSVTDTGFESEWRISSFGRSYPQIMQGTSVDSKQIIQSAAGIELHQQVDAYDMVLRSIRYAILFILITFAAFFLFDVLAGVRIHPVQYLLVGSALALFYLLLLPLAEQIGFLYAYALATTLTVTLITAYSAFVLKSSWRSLSIATLLLVLYGYLYFVLRLEDFALLFGALLLFILLAAVMYMTRNVDWFALGKGE